MLNSSPKSLHTLLNQAHKSDVQHRAELLHRLNTVLRGLLPESLHPHFRMANYRHHHLIIEISSATWLMYFRYEQETLLKHLREQILPQLKEIQFKINPDIYQPSTLTLKEVAPARISAKKNISPQTAELFSYLAEKSPPKLQQSFYRLAKYATINDNNDTIAPNSPENQSASTKVEEEKPC